MKRIFICIFFYFLFMQTIQLFGYGEEHILIEDIRDCHSFYFNTLSDSTFLLRMEGLSSLYKQEFSSELMPINSLVCLTLNNNEIRNAFDVLNLSNGNFIIYWGQMASDGYTYYYAAFFSSNGIALGSPILINPTVYGWSGPVRGHAIETYNGDIFFCWFSWNPYFGCYGQIISKMGLRIGTEFPIIDNGLGIRSIFKTNDGNLLLFPDTDLLAWVWSTQNNKIVKEQSFSEYTYGQWEFVNPLTSEDFLLLGVYWNNPGFNFLGQTVNSNLEPLSDRFQLENIIDYFNILNITPSNNGNFIIAARVDDYHTIIQEYNKYGLKLGETVKINNRQINRIFTISKDTLLLTWTEGQHGKDGLLVETDVFAQRISIKGDSLEPRFRVNTTSSGYNYLCGFLFFTNGDYMLAWEESYRKIIAKRFPPNAINHQLTKFQLVEPKNDATTKTQNPLLNWQKASIKSVAYSYELQYYIFYDFIPTFDSPQIVKVDGDTTVSLFNLTPGKTYFWKVLAKNITDDSLWSSNTNAFFVSHDATGIQEVQTHSPNQYILHQNYPNPFNPETTIRFDLPETGLVVVSIYDISGKLVKVLLNESRNAGSHSVKWDGKDLAGPIMSSGIYICQMKVRSINGQMFTKNIKLDLLR